VRILQATVIVVLGAAADLATKSWALPRLSGGHDITLAGGLLRLQLVINHGASFGLGSGYEPVLTVLTLVIVVLLWLWAVRTRSRVERIGAALADVMLRGGVVVAAVAWLLGQRTAKATTAAAGPAPVQPVSVQPASMLAGVNPANPPDPPDPDRAEDPVVPTQSREDTDVGWGEVPEPSDDDRFYRDRPPHWGSD
jgi:hypothetical protein